MHEALTSSFAASLDSAALARRLGELAGEERQVQADFLLHLDAFDRRRGYLDAGYASLWEFCQKVLHLREGAAGRRIAAMRVLRRFPVLASALREGKLCLSTLGLLGPVLTAENLEEVLARAAFRTRAEVDRLVASLQPRAAPKDGIRRVVGNGQSLISPELSIPARVGTSVAAAPALGTPTSHLGAPLEPPTLAPPGTSDLPVTFAGSRAAPAPVPGRPELRPVSEESYSLRVTLDAAFKDDLDQLRQLLSHKVPNGDLAAVLREAVRCGVEKHGKRRGAVAPTRKVASPPREDSAKAPGAVRRNVAAMPSLAEAEPRRGPRAHRPTIPAAVRREVWARDGGQCTWQGDDGRRCESRWQLELDHVVPVALGGATTVANLRLACRVHNGLSAERVFGPEHMAPFRRETPRQGEFTAAGVGAR